MEQPVEAEAEVEVNEVVQGAVRYEYVLEGTFQSKQEFEQYMAHEKCWKPHNKPLVTRNGLKTIHWCKNVKCHGPRCLAEFYTITERFPGDTEILLYRRNQAHTCDTSDN